MRRIDVGPRPTSREELAAWYAEALEAQAASGLSVAEFAQRMGVSMPTLYMWRRRLGSRSRPAQLPARLVEVTVARPCSESFEATRPTLVVRLCSGRRSIDVPAGFDDDDVRRLVAALESC